MGKIIFITGGVRSGKSAFAEQYAITFFEQYEKDIYYLASGVAFDEEMKKRINRHKEDREKSKMPWKTWEVDVELPKGPFKSGDVILWDCITTWLNNVLYRMASFEQNRLQKIHNQIEMVKDTIIQWKNDGVILLLVSNEVLDEASSKFSEVNLYRQLLGNLHQWIVSVCDEAYELDYSINVRKK